MSKPFINSTSYYRELKRHINIQNEENSKQLKLQHISLSTKQEAQISTVIDDHVPSLLLPAQLENLNQQYLGSENHNINYDAHVVDEEFSNDSEEEYLFEELKSSSIAEELRQWALSYHVSHQGVSALLLILITFGFSWLPKDCRTLLKTPRFNQVKPMGSGKFWYNGVTTNLKRVFVNIKKSLDISLTFNVDGLPIYNSSKYQFWPILARINEKKNLRLMVIAVYCGHEKPPSLQLYLEEFVSELKNILTNGILVNGFKVNIKISCFICDSPARPFLKGTVNFNSAHGCQKCEVVGEFDYYRGRHMSFPKIDCNLRTNEKFRKQTDEDHNKETTPLVELPIDLVEDFIIADSLHLLELGLMKDVC